MAYLDPTVAKRQFVKRLRMLADGLEQGTITCEEGVDDPDLGYLTLDYQERDKETPK